MNLKYPVLTKAYIYKSELDFISKHVLDCPNIETGGDLFGFWTHTGCPVIQYVIGPGKKANHQVAFFNQDVEYLNSFGITLRAEHGLQHIGQWHSHHRLGLAEPSSHDISTVCTAVNEYKLNIFLLVIANIYNNASAINGYLFRKEQQRQFDFAGWVLLGDESPVRKHIDEKYADLVAKPQTAAPAICDLVVSTFETVLPPRANRLFENWLSDKSNHATLKKILDRMTQWFSDIELYTGPDKRSFFIHATSKKGVLKFSFLPDFPVQKPIVSILHDKVSISVPTEDIGWDADAEVGEKTVLFIEKVMKYCRSIRFNFLNINK